MSPRATVVTPTHAHGTTLYHSVASALDQTVRDIEVIVVGDGVPDITREVMADLRQDSRVKFLDRPKGPHFGEVHRAAALEIASGRIICYLSDDDLWLPDHVETMESLLGDNAAFAHSLPTRINPDESIGVWGVDLALPFYRGGILAGRNWIPLSCGAHTLEAYRRLPIGWSTTPPSIGATDIYMWQKLLRLGSPVASGTRPTAVVFPSPDRPNWAMEQRTRELAEWRKRLQTAEGRATFEGAVLEYVVRDRARLFTATPRARGVDLLRRTGLLGRLIRARRAAKARRARGVI